MEILHLVRSQDDLSEDVQTVLDTVAKDGQNRVIFLSHREEDPASFDAELFGAIQRADRVISW